METIKDYEAMVYILEHNQRSAREDALQSRRFRKTI